MSTMSKAQHSHNSRHHAKPLSQDKDEPDEIILPFRPTPMEGSIPLITPSKPVRLTDGTLISTPEKNCAIAESSEQTQNDLITDSEKTTYQRKQSVEMKHLPLRLSLLPDFASRRLTVGSLTGHLIEQTIAATEESPYNSTLATIKSDELFRNMLNPEDLKPKLIKEGGKPRQLRSFRGSAFDDGLRSIDFVLVYETPRRGVKSRSKSSMLSEQLTGETDEEERKRDRYRKKYLLNLANIGIEMERAFQIGTEAIITYVKLHIPFNLLSAFAEDLNLTAPMMTRKSGTRNWSKELLAKLRIPNIFQQEVPNKPTAYYTCSFKRSKLDKFIGSDNLDTFFTPTQRSAACWHILRATAYGKKRKGEVGIEQLLHTRVMSAAFPLHDEYWAGWWNWYKYQPLDHVRGYFGEKIGIYFTWLGFYTAFLLPAAIVGVLVFMYGLITLEQSVVSNDVCNSGQTYKMCPRCDEEIGCTFWYLSETCLYTKISYLFDHPGSVFFAVFMSFWAVTFLEFWKRTAALVAFDWDCRDFKMLDERPRPEYIVLAPRIEKNPVTGVEEPYFPPAIRIRRIFASYSFIAIMMVMVCIFILAVIMYRLMVSIPLFQNSTLRPVALLISSTSGALVNLLIIIVLGKVYEVIARKLTDWEMHQTQSQHDDSFTLKVFLFQFVNYYSSIFYIAFFKGRFVGYPGKYIRVFGLRNEECGAGGCLIELAQQLMVIMVGKQIINNVMELYYPRFQAWLQTTTLVAESKGEVHQRWEEDYKLAPNEGLFEEYLEMILQFGFVTIFVVACPLAPLFALLNNWIEIRLDAHKHVVQTRRPVVERAQNIGVWENILHTLAHLAVISNGFLIAFTSEFLPQTLYKYNVDSELTGYVNFTLAHAPNGTLSEACRYRQFRNSDGQYTAFFWRLLVARLLFVVVFEHFVFGAMKVIDILVPDLPESLVIKIQRERYLAKQTLADNEIIQLLTQQDDDDKDDFLDSPANSVHITPQSSGMQRRSFTPSRVL